MAKFSKPKYDFSFIKQISSRGPDYTGDTEGTAFYSELEELLNAFEHNYLTSIKILVVPLFEKGFKVFLNYQNKMLEFFDHDPNLTEMVLSKDHKNSKNYLKSYFDINYDLLVDLRNASNNKKHDTFPKFYSFNKKQILSELFRFFVLLYKNTNGTQVEMPSDEFLSYYSSFDTFKSDRIEEVNSEAEKIRKEKVKAENDLLQAIGDKETVEAVIEKSKKELDLVSHEIKRKKLEARELDERLSKRKTDLALGTTTMANNDLFELSSELISKKDFDAAKRVFQNILNTNIQDLRGYIGLILCYYEACDIDSLLEKCGSSGKHISSTSIFNDCQKFLKEDDKAFIQDLVDTIDNEIAFYNLKQAVKVMEYDNALELIKYLKSRNANYDLKPYEEEIAYEPIYLRAKEHGKHAHLKKAVKLIERIIHYKDSEELSKQWLAKIKETEAKLEQEKNDKIKEIYQQGITNLNNHRFDEAIKQFKAINNETAIALTKKCRWLNNKYKEFCAGEITKADYVSLRKECDSDVIKIVEQNNDSLDEIEAKLEQEKNDKIKEIYQQGITNLNNHRFDEAINQFKTIKNETAIALTKKCCWLNNKYKEFCAGEITKADYVSLRNDCDVDVIKIVEQDNDSLDKIEAKHHIKELLSNRNLENFLEAYTLLKTYTIKYEDFQFSECIIDIAKKSLNINFIKSIYVDDLCPHAKEDVEKFLGNSSLLFYDEQVKIGENLYLTCPKSYLLFSDDTVDYGIKYLAKKTELYKKLSVEKKKKTLEQIRNLFNDGKYEKVIKLCESKEITQFLTKEDYERFYYISKFHLKDTNGIKNIDLLTIYSNRRCLHEYLYQIHNQQHPEEKELDFMRFLVFLYKNTKYSILIEKAILYSCIITKYNPKKIWNIYEEFKKNNEPGIIEISKDIKYIDKSILNNKNFNVNNSLIIRKTNIVKSNIKKTIKKRKRKYTIGIVETIVKKLGLFLFLLAVGAFLIVFVIWVWISGCLQESLLYRLFFSSCLVTTAIFALWRSFISIMEGAENYKELKKCILSEKHYYICLYKLALVYGIDENLQLNEAEENKIINFINENT